MAFEQRTFNVPDKLWDACKRFAEDFEKKNKGWYGATRGQTNMEGRIQQNIAGKIGEWAVWHYMNLLGLECSKPCMKIYEKHEKRFDIDLTVLGHKIHVKSQDFHQANRFGGMSGMFQYGNGEGGNHCDMGVFTSNDPSEAVALVLVNGRKATVMAVTTLSAIRSRNLWRDPVMKKHVGKKRVIYARELEAFGPMAQWAFFYAMKAAEEDRAVDQTMARLRRASGAGLVANQVETAVCGDSVF